MQYSFTATLDVDCTLGGCSEFDPQTFRIGFSDAYHGSGSGLAGNLIDTKLSSIISSEITLNNVDSGFSTGFYAGNWSGYLSPPTETVNVEFTFTVRRHELLNLIDSGREYLSFFLVGEDVENTTFHDSVPVRVKLNKVAQVRVSKLKDVEIGDNLEGTMKFCVFTTKGLYYHIYLDTLNNPGGSFFLTNSSGDTIGYRVGFLPDNNGGHWMTNDKAGRLGDGQGSSDENCNGDTNAYFSILPYESDVDDAGTGVYTDTMTITVAPYY